LSIVRDGVPEALTLFDFPDPSLIVGERATTTVPAQSLYLMNNPFVIRQAEAMADRLLAGGGDDSGRLERAYRLCYARPPCGREVENARRFMEEQGRTRSRRARGAALCPPLSPSAESTPRGGWAPGAGRLFFGPPRLAGPACKRLPTETIP